MKWKKWIEKIDPWKKLDDRDEEEDSRFVETVEEEELRKKMKENKEEELKKLNDTIAKVIVKDKVEEKINFPEISLN